MLKVQLRSKISQAYPRWRDIEDLLTGDFFGVLDYLPRQPFLKSFFSWLFRLNEQIAAPDLDDVRWESVEFSFWPMRRSRDETAEPDLFIVSNEWVFVVEVKLLSGLGFRQPWREYSVGKELAAERGLPSGSVFYLTVAPSHLNIEGTFESTEQAERQELLDRTFRLRWWQAISLITTWMRDGVDQSSLRPEHARLLGDLLQAMRLRRKLAFSGYSSVHHETVVAPRVGIFCPPMFGGFLVNAPTTANFGDGVFVGDAARFHGFLSTVPFVSAERKVIFAPSSFVGFLVDAPACSPQRTMIP